MAGLVVSHKVVQSSFDVIKHIWVGSSISEHAQQGDGSENLGGRQHFQRWMRICFAIILPHPPLKMLSATQVFAAVALLGMLAYAAADPNVFDDIETGLNHLMGHDKTRH